MVLVTKKSIRAMGRRFRCRPSPLSQRYSYIWLTSCDIAGQKCQGSPDKIRTGSGPGSPRGHPAWGGGSDQPRSQPKTRRFGCEPKQMLPFALFGWSQFWFCAAALPGSNVTCTCGQRSP